MAGKPGRSGGSRPGAGRKPSVSPHIVGGALASEAATAPEVSISQVTVDSPLEFMLALMKDPRAPTAVRLKAAQAAAPFVHAKPADAGKKGAQLAAAERVSQGDLFAPAAPPKLVVNNG
jgi:phage terminase small subunit